MSGFEGLKTTNLNNVVIDVSYVGFRVDVKDVLGGVCIEDISQEEFEKLLSKYIKKLKPHCNISVESK